MNFLLILFSFFTLSLGATDEWQAYQKILDKGVVNLNYRGTYGDFYHSSVNYKKLKLESIADFNAQKSVLSKRSIPAKNIANLAFWINAYNFFTLDTIIRNYPVESMKDLGWEKPEHLIGGTKFSLDEIEHEIIRPMNEPKIHFAVNCASVSCPPLRKEIYTQAKLDDQLTDQVRISMRNPLHIRIEDDELYVTRLFKWFDDDFEVFPYQEREGFIKKFAPKALHLEVEEWIDYNWEINDFAHVFLQMQKFPQVKYMRAKK